MRQAGLCQILDGMLITITTVRISVLFRTVAVCPEHIYIAWLQF
jgi:hypothetical protein